MALQRARKSTEARSKPRESIIDSLEHYTFSAHMSAVPSIPVPLTPKPNTHSERLDTCVPDLLLLTPDTEWLFPTKDLVLTDADKYSLPEMWYLWGYVSVYPSEQSLHLEIRRSEEG